MSNGKSRRKGLRGEQDITRRLGGRRVGVAYLNNPVDVETDFAVYQVRNRSLGGSAIWDALNAMVSKKNRYVVFKPKRGIWLVVETLEQHQLDHGEFPKVKLEEDND